MKIKLKKNFSDSYISETVDNSLKALIEITTEQLIKLGELCVADMREKAGYTTRTGNLLSSSGYALYYRGKLIKSRFEVFKQGQDGTLEGMKAADRMAIKNTNDFVLCVVAGMFYAGIVQNYYNLNVTADTLFFAEHYAPKMIETINKQLELVISKMNQKNTNQSNVKP